jgi:hypothetical protein
MDARVLRDFFLGTASAQELARDTEYAFVRAGAHSSQLDMTDLGERFEVTAAHLARLCEAVASGDLPPNRLAAIGFAMMKSERFVWDAEQTEGARIAAALNDWATPEVNYALTPATAAKFGHRLLTGEDTFTLDDLWTRRHAEES